METWFEDFKGAQYGIIVADNGDVAIGYDGSTVGVGRWDGKTLRVSFTAPHFYGRANEAPNPAFAKHLEEAVKKKLASRTSP